MMPWKISIQRLLVLLMAIPVTACAFTDGLPWGEAQPTLTLAWDPPAERLTDEGWLRTTTSFGVEIHTLTLHLNGLRLTMAVGGEGATLFDPSDPPEGYSLCHNGHCHADRGELVPYEDIAADLGADTGEGLAVVIPVPKPALLSHGADVPLGACPDDCHLPRGRLATASLAVAALEVDLTVHDLLTGDAAQLPPEGMAVSATFPLDVDLTVVIDAPFGKDHPGGVQIDLLFNPGATLFDGIAWDLWSPGDQDVPGIVSDNLKEGAGFFASVSRN